MVTAQLTTWVMFCLWDSGQDMTVSEFVPTSLAFLSCVLACHPTWCCLKILDQGARSSIKGVHMLVFKDERNWRVVLSVVFSQRNGSRWPQEFIMQVVNHTISVGGGWLCSDLRPWWWGSGRTPGDTSLCHQRDPDEEGFDFVPHVAICSASPKLTKLWNSVTSNNCFYFHASLKSNVLELYVSTSVPYSRVHLEMHWSVQSLCMLCYWYCAVNTSRHTIRQVSHPRTLAQAVQ